MSLIRPSLIDTDNVWKRLVVNKLNERGVAVGEGLSLSKGSQGTRINMEPDTEVDHLTYVGDYDINAEYKVNDIVSVPFGNYIDPGTSASLDIDASSVPGYSQAPISLGSFLCVQYVPPSWMDEDLFTNQIAPLFQNDAAPNGYIIPFKYQQGTRWDDDNIYYPVYPLIDESLQEDVDSGYGFDITANNTFWVPLGFGTIKMNACVNLVQQTTYVQGFVSGSVFNTDYLLVNTAA